VIFLSFLHIGSKITGLIGQLSSLIAVLMSLMYIIYFRIVVDIAISWGWGNTTTPSIWAYLTLIIGITAFIFIAINKKKLNSE
jgi:hypothetical protein